MLSVSRASPRARFLQSRASSAGSTSSAVSPAATLLQWRCGCQAREICFGMWASHFVAGNNGHSRRRRRLHRRHDMDWLQRALSWESDPKAAMKKAMEDLRGGSSKYVDVDEVKSWSDDVSGVRPGAKAEDFRAAMDHLYNDDMLKSPFKNFRRYLDAQRDAFAGSMAGEGAWTATASPQDAETVIDPISNRRVPKSSRPVYDDIDAYEPSDFADVSAAPEHPPKYNDRGNYEPNIDNTASTAAGESASSYNDIGRYGSTRWNEPDGLRNASTEEASTQYNDLDKYADVQTDSPDIPRNLTAEEQSKCYKDLDQYQSVTWNDPDGLRKEPREELSKNYNDLHKYGAVYWNEPDGVRKPTPEELSKNYKDLDRYGAATWNEPDGLRPATSEEKSKNYEDLDAYNTPFAAHKNTLKAHDFKQLDRTQKGTPRPSRVEVKVEAVEFDSYAEYHDLDQYCKPNHWNEPDGHRKHTLEENSKRYDDLHQYRSSNWEEPDGLRRSTPEELSKQYKDTKLYASRDVPGSDASPRIHPEDASKAYKDLSGYKSYETEDTGVTWIHPEESAKQYEDLAKYSAYPDEEPASERIHPEEAPKEYKDLSNYSTANYAEAEMAHPEMHKDYEDLDKYQPTSFDSVDMTYPAHPEETTKAYSDLDVYSQAPPSTLSATTATTEDSTDTLEELSPEDVRAATLRRVVERSRKSKLERAQVQSSLSADGASGNASKSELTGNYARDFPEEFSASWSTKHSSSQSSLYPQHLAEAPDAEATVHECAHDAVGASSLDESFPMEDSFRIQPALDRHTSKPKRDIAADPYSHEPQGLQTSYSEECGRKTAPVVEKHYEPAGSEAAKEDKLALYKVLAYDAQSQTVGIADASSSSVEGSAPSTLADVLLRLSNPSKFLPFFESLEAQGYEVVSGSGDVLIFHKTRPESADKTATAGANPGRLGATRINPIDMMGKPATGHFASPTGFVNYDVVFESAHKPAPPRRVAKTAEDGSHGDDKQIPVVKERKKRRIGRKVVLGTVGLTGSAYAVAVTAEYFSTRGAGSRDDASGRL